MLLLKDLLQIALGYRTDLSRTYSSVEWQIAFNLAERQGVLAVCFGGLEILIGSSLNIRNIKNPNTPLNLPYPLKMRWISAAILYCQQYELHKQAIENLAKFYNGFQIKMLLMKGYGLSLDYPVPEYRPVGDVDIYLFGHKDLADQMIELKLGSKVEREYRKHSHFSFHNVIIENHETFIDVDKHKSNVRFEEILEDCLDLNSMVLSLIPNCYLPSATWNALFLVRHAGEHFAANEILLRHLLDLGIFFRSHHNEINWRYIQKVYEEEGLMPFYDAIATICVRDLGIRADCFHNYHHNDKSADKMLADILSGKHNPPMSCDAPEKMGIIKYGFVKSLFWWRNRWKYKMVYNENLMESFGFLALNRLKSHGLLVRCLRFKMGTKRKTSICVFL